MEELTAVQSFYKGKTIFVTGGSGFMGKVLLEKLLFTCSELDKIYMLIRPKRGKSPETRMEEMLKLPMFQRIRESKPEVLKKLIPLMGDIVSDNMGLTEEQCKRVHNETHIVFHFAATLKLDAKLRDAVEMNTAGTKRMLDFSKKMKNLKAFVHLSTAFCHVDQEELYEKVYDSPHDPEDVIKLVRWLDDTAIDKISPMLLQPHPNTYTYSKRLAEKLVADEYPNIPCVIVRPSIVTSAVSEPLPGWVDNLNGPVGLIVAAGKGVLRSMHCKREYHAEFMPVDYAINSIITVGYWIGTNTEKAENIPVYNVTQSGLLRITFGEVLDRGRVIFYDYPFEGTIWYPDGDIRSSRYVHEIIVFFFHIIPAYFIDFLMLIFRQRRFMVRIQRMISDGLNVLQYFTTREWKFDNKNLLALQKKLGEKDKDLFPMDFQTPDMTSYMISYLLGARQYCMKEPLSSLPRARRQLKILYIIHLTAIYLFYFGIFYFIYTRFWPVRCCVDFAMDTMKALPVVGRVIEKVHS